jgi:hypothetical protein
MNDEKQTHTLPLKMAYIFGAEKGLGREIDDIKNLVIEWDRPYDSSLRRGHIVELFESHGLFEEFKARYWSIGNTPVGERLRRRFLKIKEQHDAWLKGSDNAVADEEDESDQAFAAEADLRDFLAHNLNVIEAGLRLYQAAERTGVEFPGSTFWLLIAMNGSSSSNSRSAKVGTKRLGNCSTTWDGSTRTSVKLRAGG